MHVILFCNWIAKKHTVNTAADFRSRLELIVTEKIRLKNREEVQITPTPIEVTASPSDIADEEQFFFTQADKNDEREQQNRWTKRTIQTKWKALGNK